MKGILFTEPLFHQVVCGEKTQTRRIINPQPEGAVIPVVKAIDGELFLDDNSKTVIGKHGYTSSEHGYFEPRYKPGEKLYLKEPYHIDSGNEVLYKYAKAPAVRKCLKWQNKLFMPAKFARYFIEITGVRMERLQDISNGDCLKEGIFKTDLTDGKGWDHYDWINRSAPVSGWNINPRSAYASLIDSIGGKGTWDRNPYVFVYDFKLTNKTSETK
ncbi:MAG: hypothetical protein LBK58_05430 [Prevotellaceae bacterium]|jgi:hypothetical protein|nr:hypothetical protein [Prevotellaceae bacterium]